MMPRWGLVPFQMTVSASSAAVKQASVAFAAVARVWETHRLGRKVRRDPLPASQAQAQAQGTQALHSATEADLRDSTSRPSVRAQPPVMGSSASLAGQGSTQAPLQAYASGAPKLRFEQTVAARVARRAALTAAASKAASSSGAAPLLQPNMWAMLKHMWAKEGTAALTRGLLPRVLTAGPASALTFVCFEQVKRLSRKTPQEMASTQDA